MKITKKLCTLLCYPKVNACNNASARRNTQYGPGAIIQIESCRNLEMISNIKSDLGLHIHLIQIYQPYYQHL